MFRAGAISTAGDLFGMRERKRNLSHCLCVHRCAMHSQERKMSTLSIVPYTLRGCVPRVCCRQSWWARVKRDLKRRVS